ncbi:MAG: ribonuclease III [Patescibacteria group bacterium]|nr:ribonuclease III [Patescibacteria group bacterium]
MEEATPELLSSSLGVTVSKESFDSHLTAFTHRSYVNEVAGQGCMENNERHEFLGDAILEHIVTEYLFHEFPEFPEGKLTNIRSALVKKETLSQATKDLDIIKYLRMSIGEDKTGGREKDYLLANLYEAVLGAIYMDQGFEEARIFVTRTLLQYLDEIMEKKLYIESKSYLQEKSQEIVLVTPTYQVEEEEGKDHDKTFTVGVYFGEKFIAHGTGSSKQLAQQDAARNAIILLKW